MGSRLELKPEVVALDDANAAELLLGSVDLEGAFEVLKPLLYVGVLGEPLLASCALDSDAIEIPLGRLELGGERVDERFADFVPSLLRP